MKQLTLILLLLFPLAIKVLAQCPIANTCSPGTAPTSNHVFGMGIYNVSVGSGTTGIINPTLGGSSDGYQDYSCTKKATILEGVPTTITVTTNPNVNENVRVWIDLNNNGSFDATTELVFSSSIAKVHAGNITIPIAATVIKNTVLRMRVSAENFSSPIPTPCSTPAYSQVEDYGVIVVPNTSKPLVNFSVLNPTVCSPIVQFQDLTQNGATSYLWSFGDNTTSTQANPSHTYSATGTYTISLKACNANGCDSLTKVNYITYQTSSLIAPGCTPNPINNCCGYGITNVNIGNGLMNNSSADGSVGYEDFTCSKILTLVAGKSYPFALTTGSLVQDFKIYIDLNNDGNFTGSNEIISQLFGHVNPVFSLIIPTTTYLNTPLRMRIISDLTGSSFNSCGGIQTGQAEDYAIKIIEPPFAAFNYSFQSNCSADYTFNDISTRTPTSWFWNFGDPGSGAANNSTLRHPTHTFSNPGTYPVTLKSCNNQGCDSVMMPVRVAKNLNINILPMCTPDFAFKNPAYGIAGVNLAGINNNTTDTSDTYFNYACSNFTDLIIGNNYQVSVSTHPFNSVNVQIWIDLNNNGALDASERVFNNIATGIHTGSLTLPPNVNPVKNTYLRMRVTSTFSNILTLPLPCGNVPVGETEDYAVRFLDPTGIQEGELADKIKAYPNPGNGLITLEVPETLIGTYKLEILDLVGKSVSAKRVEFQDSSPQQIDLSSLPKGIYQLKLSSKMSSVFKKIIIE